MVFIKTGDPVPFGIFDHKGNPMPEDEVKKLKDEESPADHNDPDTEDDSCDDEVNDEPEQ